jgi:hypothetical protein
MVAPSLISKLRRIAHAPPPAEVERCAFCGTALKEDHRHLVDRKAMKFMCTCEMCLITLSESTKYTPIPQRILPLPDFIMTDLLWSDFLIPVNMAFFVIRPNHHGAVAYYPAATGATESQLRMDAWDQLVLQNPILHDLVPDLEALLINRLGDEAQYFIVPIDQCYKLIGKIRTTWQGIFGGTDVNKVIDDFFLHLQKSSSYA